MADEKLNVSPEENPQPSLFNAGPADDHALEAPAPEARFRRTFLCRPPRMPRLVLWAR